MDKTSNIIVSSFEEFEDSYKRSLQERGLEIAWTSLSGEVSEDEEDIDWCEIPLEKAYKVVGREYKIAETIIKIFSMNGTRPVEKRSDLPDKPVGNSRETENIDENFEGLLFPPINQLRYAGRHIVDSYDDGISDTQKTVSLREAFSHCQRAINDACDSAIYFYLALCRRFQYDYLTCPISDIIPDYASVLGKLEEVTGTLRKRENSKEEISDDLSKPSKVAELQKKIELCSDVWIRSLYLDSKREAVNKKNEDLRIKIAKENLKFHYRSLAGLAGLILFSLIILSWLISR